jgi:hypothetical protein
MQMDSKFFKAQFLRHGSRESLRSLIVIVGRFILLKFMPEVLPNVPSLEELRMLVNSKAVRVAIDVDPLTIL